MLFVFKIIEEWLNAFKQLKIGDSKDEIEEMEEDNNIVTAN